MITPGEFDSDYSAAVSGAGLVVLEQWNTVAVTGRDRATFLHNMCTNDIRGLVAGTGCEAFFTDVKGKVVAHAFVLAGDDALQLVMVPDSARRLLAHLDRYVIREDVQLSDASSARGWLLLVGRRSTEVIRRLCPSLPELAQPWSHGEGDVEGAGHPPIKARVVRCDLPWCGGYLVGCGADQLQELKQRLSTEGIAAPCDEGFFTALRVDSAWPLWGVDFDATNLPQEVSRDAEAIHFRKGCYLGQETVARIDALGHVNKRLVPVQFAAQEVPPVGAELAHDGRPAGRVTTAHWSACCDAPLALAMVQRGANDPGVKLSWGDAAAEVVAMKPKAAPTGLS